MDDGNTHVDDAYCKKNELVIEQICNAHGCPAWKLAETSPVSKRDIENYLFSGNNNKIW